MTFSDGSFTECTDGHLWRISSTNHRFRGTDGIVRKLSDIRNRLHYKNGNRLWYIPLVEPVDFTHKNLEVDPYLVGLLLGDGGLSVEHSVKFTNSDQEIGTWVSKFVSQHSLVLKHVVNHDYLIIKSPLEDQWQGGPNWLLCKLRKLGLMGTNSETKFVPEDYLFSSLEDRISLFQGLMDTDGYVAKDGTLQFTTVSPMLAEAVRFLVQSFGGIARTSSKIPQYAYGGKKHFGQRAFQLTIALPPSIVPFRLSRKLSRARPRDKYPPSRAIESVEFVGKKECQCIAIDSSDHLYVTNDFIVTHNTIEFTALLLRDREEKLSNKPTLLICPTSIVGNWKRELEKFSPSVRVLIHHGSDRISKAAEFAKAAKNCDVVISTYSLIQRDVDLLSAIEWCTVALDEAQNVKNHWTKQAQAVRRLKSDHRVALTGTPIENRLSELWSIMDFLNPGYLGSFEEFRRKYSFPVERYGDDKTRKVLQKIVRPFILRRLKTDKTIITDLPKKNEMKVYCSLTEEQASL